MTDRSARALRAGRSLGSLNAERDGVLAAGAFGVGTAEIAVVGTRNVEASASAAPLLLVSTWTTDER